jgi:hypothetical protein
MRRYSFFTSAVVAIFVVLPTSAFAESGRCEELRLACEHKDQLGEQGVGDCRTYRAVCYQRTYQRTCQYLRYRCLHKDTLGVEGQGYCERYREDCRR